MRLAFVTSLVPTGQALTGFELANAAIIAALRDLGHEVKVFGFLRPDDPAPADADATVIDRFEIENAVAPLSTRLGWIADALRWGLPVASAKLKRADRGRWVAAIRAAHRETPFDGVVLNAVIAPGALPELLAIAPCLLVEHNVEYRSAEQNATHAGNRLMRWLFRREARLLKAIEHDVCAKARFVWCLAEEDRQALGLSASRSGVLPLVSATQLESAPEEAGPAFDVGLIGTWTWEPNRIGLHWFLTEVAPLLPPEMAVAVAGRVPDGMQELAPAGVTLLGRVPSASAFLACCRTIALTSRAGTGVQLKTIEAFQLGKPAIATSLSLRGFDSLPENVRRADAPQVFAAALAAHVAAVRSGQIGAVDGAAFLARQRARMAEVISAGLATLKET